MSRREVVIVSACRIPHGRYLGSLLSLRAPDLGGVVVGKAVRRAGMDPASVEDCIMGNVISAGQGQNPARQAALRGGLPATVNAFTINMVCGSGLQAVMLAAQAVPSGDTDVAVAGRDGVDVRCSPPPAEPPGRGPDGRLPDDRAMIQGWPLVRVPRRRTWASRRLHGRKAGLSRSELDEFA